MHEHTPLLRAVPIKRERRIRRYAAVLLLGFLLYCVYLILFLPRTSYQRDWNHLHDNSITRQELERRIVHSVEADSIHSHAQSYFLSGEHTAGASPALAAWTQAKFNDYGLKTTISTHKVLVSEPENASVRVISGASVIELDLDEHPINDPPTQLSDRVPPFHAYAADGNVTGPLVFAHYARKRDFLSLRNRGIDLQGVVLLVKSGKIPLPIKVRNAKMYGAAAVLTFHDGTDDGKYTEENGYKPYPDGPARSPKSIERDTVLDYTQKPAQIPRHGIPSIPVSFTNARYLLDQLHGISPGPLVEVYSQQQVKEKTLTNVFGMIPGISHEQVIVGNHRDALTLGAADGNSGSAVLIEMARVLGELYQDGWRPFRSIVFASWDGGRHGMLGSTAWASENRRKLRKHASAYIDIGAAYTGPEFVAKASPLLRRVIRDCAARSPSPDLLGTMQSYWSNGSHGHTHVGTLSTGDFNAFYNHLGIPALTAQFQSNTTTNVYHRGSNYDTLQWQRLYGDTDFSGHAALTRLIGLITAQLVSTPVLPLRATEYGRVIQRNALIMLGERDEDEIQLFHEACSQFVAVVTEYDRNLDKLQSEYVQDYPWYKFWKKLQLGILMHIANFRLMNIERNFLFYNGLNGRPWYRHVFIGPDRESGKTRVLPGLYEALESGDKDEVFYWVGVLTDLLRQSISSLS